MMMVDQVNWKTPNLPLVLSYNQVHVWYGNCTSPLLNNRRMWEMLSLEEKNRANRYRSDLDRKRFIVRRSAARLILSQYVDTPPRSLEIRDNALGKPRLSRMAGKENFFFSLSHSQDIFICAVCHVPKIGIDVEYMHTLDFESVLRTLYIKDTNHTFSTQRDKKLEFYRIWTLLESYLKAIGAGFTNSIDDEFWNKFPVDFDLWQVKDPSWEFFQFLPEQNAMASLMVNIPGVVPEFYEIINTLEQKS